MDVEGDVGREQRGEHVLCPIRKRPLWKIVEDRRLEHVDAAVAQIRERLVGVWLLLKTGHPPLAVVQHNAVLARVGHLLDGERGDPTRFAMPGGERLQVDVRQRVARNDEEGLSAEEVRALAHAPRCAEQLRLVAVGDALAKVLADAVLEIVQVGDYLLEAVAGEQLDDVLHHGAVEHRHHRLGDLVRQRPQARAQPRRQHHRSHRRVSRTPAASGRSVAVMV